MKTFVVVSKSKDGSKVQIIERYVLGGYTRSGEPRLGSITHHGKTISKEVCRLNNGRHVNIVTGEYVADKSAAGK